MFELNFCDFLVIPLIFLTTYMVWSRLRKPREYRNLSSHMPSVTKTLWDEMKFSWTMARNKPKDILPCFMNLIKKYGSIFHFTIFGVSYVFLTDPEDLRVLLSSNQHISKGPEYKMLIPWLNESIALSTGSKWRRLRKLHTNAFHYRRLHTYNYSMNSNARIFVKQLLKACTNNQEICIIKYVKLCALDLICDTIMDTEMKAQEGKSVKYVETVKTVCESLTDRIFTFWLRSNWIFGVSGSGKRFYKAVQVLHDYTDNVIKNKKTLLNNENNENALSEDEHETSQQNKSFLDALLRAAEENPDLMNNQDVRGEVDTFLFAGHDTTSLAITMTLLLLGIYQDVQDRARDEIINIFGDSDREVTMEDLNNMPYVEAVIKESLRLYPSVPAIMRTLHEPLQLKNYTIPPMTVMAVYPYIVHRNERIYPNPENFIPERFLDEDNKSKFLFGYIPFSAGPRNCIAQKYAMNQLKTIVSTILRNAKFETLGTQDDIQVCMEIALGFVKCPKMKFYNI